jgi:hypothetical protein
MIGHRASAPAAALTALTLAITWAGVTPSSAHPRKRPSHPGPNPYLSLLPDPSQSDTDYWRTTLAALGKQRAAKLAQQKVTQQRLGKAVEPLLVDEREPDALRGGNDTPATAEMIPAFGTGRRDRPAARVLGTLAASAPATTIGPFAEDDGSIPLANVTGLSGSGAAVTAQGTIGNGPHGSTGDNTGDFDVFSVPAATAGERLTAAAEARASTLDSLITLYSSDGTELATNDDGGGGFNARLTVTLPASGNYYLLVAGFGLSSRPTDPFDSGSGGGTGSEGAYTVSLGLNTTDVDTYAIDLAAGDTIGASVGGGVDSVGAGSQLTVYGPDGKERVGSQQDASGIYPAASPLPGGGTAVLAHVAATAGRYTLAVTGEEPGNYDITVEAYRPRAEAGAPGTTPTIFLDFDGQRVNTAIFGGPGVRTLSPLSAFLGRWGLTASDENAIIDRVIATVTENIKTDLGRQGVAVKILNSRDHADPFGKPSVSRLIVGGTVAESGVSTIGIAQSIDPGNFEQEETALVLLDILSDPPAGDGSPDPSLNGYLTSGSDRVAFIGTALGNVVSHEAGHFVGSFHVDQFNAVLNLMDQGGNFPLLFGVGRDGVGGTGDDRDVDFGWDTYNPNEGFTGSENTAATTRFGLSPVRTGTAAAASDKNTTHQ